MKKHIKLVSIILTILLTAALFSGCGKSESTTLIKVRLNEVVRSVFYAPMYAAISKGYFKEEGLDIELSTGQGADKTMQQVLSKNADIGFCGPEQVIYLYNQGREDYCVLFAQCTKRDGSFLVGRKDEADFKWESLKGKTIIGGRPGGVPEMALEYVLRNHGLIPGKDVKLITNLAFTATSGAFISGTGDYAALFEPTPSMMQKDKTAYIVTSVGTASGEIPYTCFFTTKSYMDNNPEIVQKFTNALYKGQLYVDSTASKDVAAAILDFFPGTDIDLLTTVVERYKAEDAWAKNPILAENQISNLENVIQSYQADLLPTRPPYEKIVTTKFADEAIKNIKK